jgi:hypothetical protein
VTAPTVEAAALKAAGLHGLGIEVFELEALEELEVLVPLVDEVLLV